MANPLRSGAGPDWFCVGIPTAPQHSEVKQSTGDLAQYEVVEDGQIVRQLALIFWSTATRTARDRYAVGPVLGRNA